jgi:hypothetical protein
MSSTVFISHAGADAARATAVAQSLAQAGIDARFDRSEVSLGDSFLSFMDEALTTSDYCLLLWSTHAAGTPWVAIEWEAALYRSVREKRGFLVVGRLEELSVPALLEPRLRIDLFPSLEPGLMRLVSTWRADRKAERRTGKPVGAAWTASYAGDQPTDTIYIDSEQFGMTAPVQVSLEQPAGAFLDQVIASFGFPNELSHAGMIGVRLSYRLLDGDVALNRAMPLEDQGVTAGRVLTLQTTMTPFSTADPVKGRLSSTVFRGRRTAPDHVVLREAMNEYRDAVRRAGLLPPE